MALHAEYSASGSERWLNCAGSIAMAAISPEQDESPYAAEGTTAHTVFEHVGKQRVIVDENSMVERIPKIDRSHRRNLRQRFDSDMVDYAIEAFDWIVEERIAPILEFGVYAYAEQKVDAAPFTKPGQFGTLDYTVFEEFGRLVVVDYKYGAGHVVDPAGIDGEGNPQLIYYALGIAYRHEFNFSEVELAVIQPRGYHPEGESVKTYVMSIERLKAWAEIFKAGVKKAEAAKLMLLSGRFKKFAKLYLSSGPWCQFCPASAFCPRISTMALTESGISSAIDEIEFEDLEPRDIGKMLSEAQNIEHWIKRLKGHAFGRLSRGDTIPGFKLAEKRPTQKWVVGAEDRLKEADIKWAFKKSLITPAQFKKKMKSLSRPRDFQEAEWFAEEFIEKVSSGVTLVKEDDARVAKLTAEDYFL